jgi:muramoyltetrapeptide carboxypeptidase
LIGTPINPSYAGHVVVLEDVGEPWYRCDRSLTHLLVATDLRQAKAVVLGTFIDCEEGTSTRLAERLIAAGVPCLRDAPVGHGVANHAFVWGERATFAEGTLTLTGGCA